MRRALVALVVVVGLWQAAILLMAPPAYILPAPLAVLRALIDEHAVLLDHAATTGLELALGIALGLAGGGSIGLAIAASARARTILLPMLVASQAVPIFALAPILVLWLGYGITSKVVAAALIIGFPVAASLIDGLGRTEPGWSDLLRVMGAHPIRAFWFVRLPAALPSLGTGLRLAAATAPIGVVIGEWVGASSGLGFLMLQANARLRVDLMYAALLVLAGLAIALYLAADRLARLLAPWASPPSNGS